MTKTAWVFPGQGSQAVGMADNLLELPKAIDRFEEAEQILGWSIVERCQGDAETLSRTLYTQPCLYTIESILVDVLKAQSAQPTWVAGHSLGEYVALYAAGVFDFAAGLRLVKRRAELMENASGGLMAALLGFNREQLIEHLQQTSGVVLANDNNDGQVVVSGQPDAVEAILQNVKSKRAVKLNVSGAFHSPFMATAAAEFCHVLNEVSFQDAQVPVLSNVDPTPATVASELKARLIEQMTGSVRWREITQALLAAGVTQVIEVGPGKVLTGIMKRALPGVELINVSNLSEVPTALLTC